MNGPLVSIICFCKNRHTFIRRCIESILNQDYENFEFLIQDGASTDGTVEIIKEYRDQRIKLVSEPDSGPGEAFMRAMSRIRGDIWGSCLSDEELFPHAISWAVSTFANRHDTAVIYGDCHVIDECGAIIESCRSPQWDYLKYLCCEIVPPFSATFLRTACFRKIGFDRYTGCGEFDLWLRMGKLFEIEYIPEFVSKFTRHKGGGTSTVEDFYKTLPGRIKAIEKICDATDTPEYIKGHRNVALGGLHLWIAQNFITNHHYREAGAMIIASLEYTPRREYVEMVCRAFAQTVGIEAVIGEYQPVMTAVAQYLDALEQQR